MRAVSAPRWFICHNFSNILRENLIKIHIWDQASIDCRRRFDLISMLSSEFGTMQLSNMDFIHWEQLRAAGTQSKTMKYFGWRDNATIFVRRFESFPHRTNPRMPFTIRFVKPTIAIYSFICLFECKTRHDEQIYWITLNYGSNCNPFKKQFIPNVEKLKVHPKDRSLFKHTHNTQHT